MVMDGAPCHNEGERLKIPNNIEILKLPPYSPQLNPAENMFDEIREKFFGNLSFSSMDNLEEQMVYGLLELENNPDKIKSITGWNWILTAYCKLSI